MKGKWNDRAKKMGRLLGNNKGVTLVELLVALSIAAVLLSVFGISMAITPSTEAKRTNNSIDSMITRCKVGTLSKSGDVYMQILQNDNKKIVLNYYEDDRIVQSETVTSGGVTVSYVLNDGSTTKKILSQGESFYLAFNRRTGGFETLGTAFALAGTTYSGDSSDTGKYIEWIYVNGGPAEYNIKLGVVTGSHSLNQ